MPNSYDGAPAQLKEQIARRKLAASNGGHCLIACRADEKEASAGSIVDVGGLRVGHHTDSRRPTGCTVVIFEGGAVAGVDVRGAAPGTRETDLLNPLNTVQKVNAILLAGGSAFGLDAASGVMRYLEENKMGYRVGPGDCAHRPGGHPLRSELGRSGDPAG